MVAFQQRVMVFIDGSNLFRGFKNYAPGVNYSVLKIIDKVKDNRYLVRPYYFSGEPVPIKQGQKAFFDRLRYEGVDVSTRPLKQRTKVQKCPYDHEENCEITYQIEKGVDVALITKMLSFAFKGAYDVAILISGDEDFVEAVDEIRNLGKRVEICSFKESISPALRKLADKFVTLNDIIDDVKI